MLNVEATDALRQPREGKVSALSHRITESQNSRGWKGPLWVI